MHGRRQYSSRAAGGTKRVLGTCRHSPPAAAAATAARRETDDVTVHSTLTELKFRTRASQWER